MMVKKSLTNIFFLFFLTITVVAAAGAPSEIRDAQGGVSDFDKTIEEKNVELKRIQEEREKLEQGLSEIQKVKGSLNGEVKNLDYNIKQLDFAVQSNKVAVQKFELELGVLEDDLRGSEKALQSSKNTLSKLMEELYERDNNSVLLVFFKNETLSGGISELETLFVLNENLNESVAELEAIQSDLKMKAVLTEEKKRQRELEKVNLQNRQLIINDQKMEKQKLLAQTKNQEQVFQAKINELEKQQLEISRIISEYEKKIRESFNPSLLPSKRGGVLAYPVSNPIKTQGYGKTKFAERAYRTGFHGGVDFGVRLGTPVFAAEDGVVKISDNNDRGSSRWQKYQFGLYILINHSNNLSTLYAHLSRAVVRAGDRVKRGGLIGYSGNTGYSTGPHLHLSVYWTSSVQLKSIPPAAGLVPVGVTVNPEDYL